MITRLSNPSRVFVLLAASGAVVLLGAACGGREDAGTEQAAPSAAADERATQAPRPIRAEPKSSPDASQPAQTAADTTIQTLKGGGFRIENGGAAIELPGDFPSDLPLFPDATPTLYTAAADGSTTTNMIVDDSMEGAHRYYQDELESEGWELERGELPAGDLAFINATKGDRVLLVGIVDNKGETVVSLIETP